jgi:hypothetical protein
MRETLAFTSDGRTFLIVYFPAWRGVISAELRLRGQGSPTRCAPCPPPQAARRIPVPAWDRGWAVLGPGQDRDVEVARLWGPSWFVDLVPSRDARPADSSHEISADQTAVAGKAVVSVRHGATRRSSLASAYIRNGRVFIPTCRPRVFTWVVFLADDARAVLVGRTGIDLPPPAALPPLHKLERLGDAVYAVVGEGVGDFDAWKNVRNAAGAPPAIVRRTTSVPAPASSSFPVRLRRGSDGPAWRADLVTWPDSIAFILMEVPYQLRVAGARDGSMAFAPGWTTQARTRRLAKPALVQTLDDAVVCAAEAREAYVDFERQQATWRSTSLAEGPLGHPWTAFIDRKLAYFEGRTLVLRGFPDDIRGFRVHDLPDVLRRGDVIVGSRYQRALAYASRYLVPVGVVDAVCVSMDAPDSLQFGDRKIQVRHCVERIVWWKDGRKFTIDDDVIHRLPLRLDLPEVPHAVQVLREGVEFEVYSRFGR